MPIVAPNQTELFVLARQSKFVVAEQQFIDANFMQFLLHGRVLVFHEYGQTLVALVFFVEVVHDYCNLLVLQIRLMLEVDEDFDCTGLEDGLVSGADRKNLQNG